MLIYSLLAVKDNPEKLNAFLEGLTGISGSGLYAVRVNEIVAVTGDISRAELLADTSNALVFAAIIESLMQEFPVLPMRYGSFLESADAVSRMIERNYEEIELNLKLVENKLEFGLKIFCDSEKLKTALQTVSETDATISQNTGSESHTSVFREYVNTKLKAHRLEELLLSHVDKVIAGITQQLDRMDALSKFKKIVAPATVIDGVFLLEKDKKEELIKAIKDLQEIYPGMDFVLTGPWPPYNFVETTIK